MNFYIEKLIRFTLLVGVAGLTSFSALAGESAREKTMETTFDTINKEYIVINFADGSTNISAYQRDKVRAFIDSIDDKSGAVLVLSAWSDKPSLDEKATNQSKEDKTIAQRRLDALNEFINRSRTEMSVETHNMAIDPTFFSRLVKTNDAKLKEGVQGKGVADSQVASVVEVLRDNGGPSRAVLVLKRAH